MQSVFYVSVWTYGEQNVYVGIDLKHTFKHFVIRGNYFLRVKVFDGKFVSRLFVAVCHGKSSGSVVAEIHTVGAEGYHEKFGVFKHTGCQRKRVVYVLFQLIFLAR